MLVEAAVAVAVSVLTAAGAPARHVTASSSSPLVSTSDTSPLIQEEIPIRVDNGLPLIRGNVSLWILKIIVSN